jgi:hypothetical protein
MITIDIVDDNNDRLAKPVVQTIPIASNGRNECFDATNDAARRADKASAAANRDLVGTLSRIARALSAWL